MEVDELLRVAMQWGANDVHLVVPASPMLRLNHELVPVSGELLTPSEVKKAFESITSEKQQKAFYRDLELDFAYSISGLGRFRVNASMQRGSIALTIRCLPVKVPSVTTLLAKGNSFLEHAQAFASRYVLKAPSKPEIHFSALTVQVLRRDLLSATSNLKFLKSCGRQTLSLFHFYRLSPTHICKSIISRKEVCRNSSVA
jgi:hypothetical protein